MQIGVNFSLPITPDSFGGDEMDGAMVIAEGMTLY